MNTRTRTRILSYLAHSDFAKNSVSAIAAGLRINRVTLAKYLSVLESEGEISSTTVGMAKLWKRNNGDYLHHFADKSNGKLLKGFLNHLGVGVRVLDSRGSAVWSNAAFRALAPHARAQACLACLLQKAPARGCPAAQCARSGKSAHIVVGAGSARCCITLTPVRSGAQTLVLEQVTSAGGKILAH